MKKIKQLILSSVLMLVTIACSDTTKTSANAPDSTKKTGETPATSTSQENKNDATSKVRLDQLNSDIRAGEQRNNITGGDTDRANSELSSSVRSKLEANIPNGSLTVSAKEGAIVVSGTVPTQDQLNKIEGLAKQIKGVTTVSIVAKVAPATKQ